MSTSTSTSRKARALPEPDFGDSADLRTFCDQVRRALHAGAMHLHHSASEIEAALMHVKPKDEGMWAKAVRRRRARKVARHMRHAAECLVAGSAASVRTWGAFRAEYAPELPGSRGRRAPFRIVSE